VPSNQCETRDSESVRWNTYQYVWMGRPRELSQKDGLAFAFFHP
jgi:hypothetical protein